MKKILLFAVISALSLSLITGCVAEENKGEKASTKKNIEDILDSSEEENADENSDESVQDDLENSDEYREITKKNDNTVVLNIKNAYDAYPSYQTFAVKKVTIIAKCPSDKKIEDCVQMRISANCYHRDVVGRVGSPIEIDINEEIKDAKIIFEYDPEKLGYTSQDNLIFLCSRDDTFYDIHADDAVLDKEHCTLTMPYTGKGTYIMEDKLVWYRIWNIKE